MMDETKMGIVIGLLSAIILEVGTIIIHYMDFSQYILIPLLY
jgi:hypothetical protein